MSAHISETTDAMHRPVLTIACVLLLIFSGTNLYHSYGIATIAISELIATPTINAT